jgi:hypothetical protein
MFYLEVDLPESPGLMQISGFRNGSRVFGLELSDYIPPSFDASADSLNFDPPLTIIPAFLVAPINWNLITTNRGSNSLDTIFSDFTVNDGLADVFTSTDYDVTVPSFSTVTIPVASTYTPPAVSGEIYTATAITNTGVQADMENSNDTVSYFFSITDTTMGRNGVIDGSIGFDSLAGTIALMFDMPVITYATSATFGLSSPPLGDSVIAELYDWNGTTPGNLIASSATYIIAPQDTSGVFLTLPFTNAPLQLTPGSYILGIKQHFFNVSIAYSFFNWRPNTTWVYLAANNWLPSENYNSKIVPFINLNIWSQAMISVNETDRTIFSAYPNPASTQFTFDLPNSGKHILLITDVQGKLIYQNTFEGQREEVINTSEWSNGLYFIKVETDGKNYFSKMTISK